MPTGARTDDELVELAQIAQRVMPSERAFVDRLVEYTSREIVDLDHAEPNLARLLRNSISDNVARLVSLLAHDEDPRSSAPPAAALEYARELARHNGSLASLLRAYRIGQAEFTSHCLVAADEFDTTARVQISMVNLIAAYLDHVCETVARTFQDERAQWIRSRIGLRQVWTQRLLARNAAVDIDEAEAALGYRLRGNHLGFEAWFARPGELPLTAFERLAEALGRRYAADGVLVVPAGDRSARIWLALGGSTEPSAESVVEAVTATDPALRLAVGVHGRGPVGFRIAHEAACSAAALASMRGTDAPVVTAYRDVAPVALLRDSPAAARFVVETLGELADESQRCTELRGTLLRFLECGRSFAQTAESMHLHRNTVHYRVQQAAARYGRDLDDDTLNLMIALQARNWGIGGSTQPS